MQRFVVRFTLPRLFQTAAFVLILLLAGQTAAQQPAGPPSGGNGGFDPAKMNIGRFYGKVVDENGKGVGYATVKLYGMKFDPQTRTASETLLSGQLTAENGDFSLEKLPVAGDFTLKISYIGYAETVKKVSFGVKPPAGGPGAKKPEGAPAQGGPPAGGFPGMGGNFDKDLGNLSIAATSQVLEGVTIKAEAATATLALDKKVFRVDKDVSAAGGNAQDALKNVPSLSVDIDGNVSLRNGAPQIFVDGRPTTLSLDQIPANAIESVEVITNPSAKYDAGGGTAGIVNIVLKKERRLGYNGNVRAGVDSRAGFNSGADLNARGEKINLFVSGNLNRMKGIHESETFRQNLFGTPLTNLTQATEGGMQGYFANARAGLDWLMDNRNTLTFSGNLNRGQFNPHDRITTRTDSLLSGRTPFSEYMRNSEQERNFRNLGASAQFKHLFPKQGAEWTADVNYNRVRFKGGSDFATQFSNGAKSKEKQEGHGKGQFVTIQSDVVYPLAGDFKLETGVRAALRRNRNDNGNFVFSQADGDWGAGDQLSRPL
jgi:Outer membrane protein beta-barrel family/Carboxypeptidase regulatory-like domain/TonB-dependent Receptor Plug Domain